MDNGTEAEYQTMLDSLQDSVGSGPNSSDPKNGLLLQLSWNKNG